MFLLGHLKLFCHTQLFSSLPKDKGHDMTERQEAPGSSCSVSPAPDGVTDESRDVLATWAASFRAPAEATELPAHHELCLGCGPENPHGHHLVAWREADGVVAEHSFDTRHVGAPGIAHGGAVATVMDDLFGFLLYVVGTLAVTRTLQVDYRAPVLLGQRYALRADLLRREGRRMYMEATMGHGHTIVAEASAVFVAVEHTHFTGSVGGNP